MEMNPISIRLNGAHHPLDGPVPLSLLLESLGLSGKPVVVELDEDAVFPKDYPTRIVTNGSRVEIVVLAAGG